MSSIEERLQIKREPLDKWSIREQLCLAVARMNDQNLTSVSRALKPFGESNRPSDWFHQKNCAAQYGALLANVETPKRKKRTSAGDITIEAPTEAIVRKLMNERKAELKKLLAEEKAEYLKLQRDKALLQTGNVTEEQLDIWCKEIDEEEQRKEQEAATHEQWLRERELKKQEIERAWRPVKPIIIPGQKRKNSENIDGMLEEIAEEQKTQELPKPALSPLLTSLLKSPSQVPNVATSSILHSAITNQRPTNTNSNPMIASLLNSSTEVTVSPGLQQLVSSAIGQDPAGEEPDPVQNVQPNDILDDANLQILKIDDLANSILIQNGPLPEMKNDVDVIISDLIDNAQDIVADPEQHLEIDGNGDLNLSLELTDFEDSEPETKLESKEIEKVDDRPPSVDPFEFQDECVEPPKDIPSIEPPQSVTETIEPEPADKECFTETPIKSEVVEEGPNQDTASTEEVPEKVKTPEPVEEKPEEIPPQIEVPEAPKAEVHEETVVKEEPEPPEIKVTEEQPKTVEEEEPPPLEEKKEVVIEPTVKSPEFNDELYDDLTMEVKVDKSGKAKRDYSRTKKREDKDYDVLSVIEKAPEEHELTEDTFSEKDFEEKKDKLRVISETDRSNSPWTEEEDITNLRSRRRVSTPATPIDSIPNSPVSSIYFYDDDREYRNWKKSVMLVYSRLAANKYASLFTKPITDEQAPGYHSVIYRPMDLLTIRKNIENGTIRTTQEFQRDVMLMFTNAIMYNKTNDTVYNMTIQMQQESMQQIQILLQAQSQPDLPARRETRTSEPGLKRKRTNNEDHPRMKKRKDD